MRKQGYDDVDFWLELALKREKGQNKSKKRSAEQNKGRNVMYYSNEDNETGSRRQITQQQAAGGGGELDGASTKNAEGVKQGGQSRSLYPALPSPPEYEESDSDRPITRSKGEKFEWSKTLGESLVQGATASIAPSLPPPFFPSVGKDSPPNTSELYPMIQVANPNAGAEGAADTILVYRTWTLEDIKKALAGITSYKEDVNRFVEEMDSLRQSYHLNGHEVQQAWMTALGSDWHHVRGGWNPLSGSPPAVLAHNDRELSTRVDALAARTIQKYKRRANYTEISRIKQKEEETFDDFRTRMMNTFKMHSGLVENDDENGPYKQQLKNALHAGSKDAIRSWVTKFFINGDEEGEILEAGIRNKKGRFLCRPGIWGTTLSLFIGCA
ncbi:uncharacterized protein LOC116724565 [Xiphophorus hellerii]|uniref:uncharacterized protein LOC116724565 n=1 Tax=Xiphophorus hellerii TaxID=8084 RepID=UPI0013B3F704|nr:uncharacterized protein LOC116724565 [Xiphophorus hellerii]